MKLANIGFGNLVCVDKIIAIVTPESSPIKKMLQDLKEKGLLIDATCGKKMKSVVFMENNNALVSALAPDIIYNRLNFSEDKNEGKLESNE